MHRDTKQVIRTGDPLPDWTRDIIGKSVQIRIPLRDPIELRRQAAILREMANRLDVLSRDKRPTESIMLEVWGLARSTQTRLKSQPKSEQIWGLKKTVLNP